MESTRPIRALTRGLDALTVLNSHDGATVSEVAQEIRLPRTTVYRILETLCESGFTFDDESWVSCIAKPCLEELGREIVWPVAISTLSGTRMMVRETTDHATPLAIERYSAGFRAPLLSAAPGRAYLAFCPASQRDNLFESLAQSNEEEDKPARTQRAELLRMLAEIESQGYAVVVRTRRMVEEVSVAVPVRLRDRVLAVLTVRFASSAVPLKSGLERFLPRLHECASKIGTLYSEQRDRPQATPSPDPVA